MMYRLYYKRLIDIIGSAILLILLLPIMCIIGTIVYINLGKPILFKQKRPGLDGRTFSIYKFRSMSNALGIDGELLPDHMRINSFGRLLRSTSLDELPELFNVLIGDMSLIGPRPLLVRDLVFMNREQLQRQKIRPGITGLAQVKGRNMITWDKKLEYDLQYIDNINFTSDLKIVATTILKVASREGIMCNTEAEYEDFGDYLLRQDRVSMKEYSKKMEMAKAIQAGGHSIDN